MRVTPVDAGALASSTFLQSAFWAAFKSSFGWKALAFSVQYADDAPAFSLSVLVRRLPLGLSFAYVPHGPDCESPVLEQGPMLAALARVLRSQLPDGCLFLRFDPVWHEREPTDAREAAGRLPSRPGYGKPLCKSSDVQPPDTVLIDLTQSLEELLAGMKSKWRYNIKLAEKKGVSVSDEGLAALDDFYELYTATSKRDGIALHSKAYYRRLFELAAEPGTKDFANDKPSRADIRLWVARHEGQALAAIVTLFYGVEAVYLYGASGDEKRNLMPAYALQWAAMQAAKAIGCTRYDLYGIPPADDPDHPMAGLYRFKTGFGGEILHYSGTYDYVYKPFIYAIMRTLERARLWWHKGVKKKLSLR